MSTHGDYFGEVTHALTNLVADRSEPLRDRLVPQASAPNDLPAPKSRGKQAHYERPASAAVDLSTPLLVVLDGPGVIGL